MYTNIYTQYTQYLLTGMCTQTCMLYIQYLLTGMCTQTNLQYTLYFLTRICTQTSMLYTWYLLTGTCTQTSTHNTLGNSSQGCVHKHLHTIHLVPPHRDVHTNTNAVPPHAVHSVLPCRWGVHKHLHTVLSYLLTGRCVHTTHWEMCV